MGDFKAVAIVLGLCTVGLLIATIVLAVQNGKSSTEETPATTMTAAPVDILHVLTTKGMAGENVCEGKKPTGPGWDNSDCMVDEVVSVLEQAGANVTVGYVGGLDVAGREPITEEYYKVGLCPVNVHWHVGAEHLSVGEFDEEGSGPGSDKRRLGSEERLGFQCHHYDESDPKFTTPYEWQFCKDMEVGQTYEIHWPHSAAGKCGTPNQYQTPFYDGVFCDNGVVGQLLDGSRLVNENIGVQGQVFTVVNDDTYYYPDLIKGMIVDGAMGQEITKYTGSTTGTSRDNDICSNYAPITWQVDRKCHMISASSFDKLCADMLTQRDDMEGDTHPHGARTLVADHIAASNHVNFRY